MVRLPLSHIYPFTYDCNQKRYWVLCDFVCTNIHFPPRRCKSDLALITCSQNCVRDYLGNPGCCPIGIRCGGPAPDPITYTWTSRTTSTYTYTRTTSTYTSPRTWSTSSTFFTTLETSDVITNTPEPTIFSATTSSPLTSSSSTSRTSSTTTATQPAQTPTGGPIIVSGASKRVEGGVIFALWTTAILLLI